jgi:DNA-binding transcriptional LysR family regulator
LARRGVAVFNDLRASIAELDFLADPTAGELRIGSTEPMAAGLLSAIVDRLSRQHPRIAFHVTLGDLPRMQEGELRDREIDLLIGRMSNATPPDDIDMKVLFYERARVAAGVKNPWTSRRKFELEDLLGEPWCLPPSESFPGSLIAGAFGARGLHFPRTAVTAHSIQMQIALLATGRFLTILPETMLRFSAKRLSLTALPVDVPIQATPVAIVTLKNRTQNRYRSSLSIMHALSRDRSRAPDVQSAVPLRIERPRHPSPRPLESTTVKVFGRRPRDGGAAYCRGRRTKTSKGGNRGRRSGAVARALWGFDRRGRCA